VRSDFLRIFFLGATLGAPFLPLPWSALALLVILIVWLLRRPPRREVVVVTVALGVAIAALGVRVNTPHLEYIDRSTDAEIVRGLWRNEHTVVQHPTIHHWPKEPDPVECKKLFVQNFPGDPSAAERLFRAPAGPVERDGWVFETGRGVYAPAEYWELAPRPWVEGPVSLTSAPR